MDDDAEVDVDLLVVGVDFFVAAGDVIVRVDGINDMTDDVDGATDDVDGATDDVGGTADDVVIVSANVVVAGVTVEVIGALVDVACCVLVSALNLKKKSTESNSIPEHAISEYARTRMVWASPCIEKKLMSGQPMYGDPPHAKKGAELSLDSTGL